MPTVAFIGLGNMGGPMAKNLLKADWAVTAFDLSESALSDVVAAGAVAAPSAHDATSGADVVVSMLPAGKHVKSVMLGDAGIFSRLPKGALVLTQVRLMQRQPASCTRPHATSALNLWIRPFQVASPQHKLERWRLCAVALLRPLPVQKKSSRRWAMRRRFFMPGLTVPGKWPKRPIICCWPFI